MNDDTEVTGRLYAWKCRSVLSRISSATILHRFRSAPLMHWAVLGWRPFKSAHGTSIAQRGQHMWGGFPFPRMITVSRTCRCKKGTCIPVLISGLPLHPSICHPLSPSASGKEIRYVCVYPAGGVATTNLPSQHYQFRSKLQSLHLYPLAGPVGEALSHNLLFINLLQLGSNCISGAVDHPKCLPEIGMKPHPVKQTGEGVECPLRPIRVGRRDQSVVRVEEDCTLNHVSPLPVLASCAYLHQ